MSKEKIQHNSRRFALYVSSVITTFITMMLINKISLPISYMIGNVDIFIVIANVILFPLLLFPCNKFFIWLYSESPNST